ncbi:MAG TPA: hypothetical protein VFW53_12130 [Gallionella sp.]|nr:hypothetical protein [Gallionella sp.]
MQARVNLFFTWFFIPQTLAMGWVAGVGRVVLELSGATTYEGDIPGRIVGALLLMTAVYVVLHFRRSLPLEGNPDGQGYRFGHRVVLAANLLAVPLFIFPFTSHLIADPNLVTIASKFSTAFGYWTMALWVIGLSFLYQSSLPNKQ